MGVAPSAFGGALSAMLVGLGAGALFIGPLGDHYSHLRERRDGGITAGLVTPLLVRLGGCPLIFHAETIFTIRADWGVALMTFVLLIEPSNERRIEP